MKTVNISEQQHGRLRLLAAKRKTSIKQIVKDALDVILALSGKKGKP